MIVSHLDIKSAALIGSDVFDASLQVLELQLPFQAYAKLSERWSVAFQGNWAELETTFITADLGLYLLGVFSDRSDLFGVLLWDRGLGSASDLCV